MSTDAAAVAVAGLMTVQAVQLFHQSAPKLSDIRAAGADDTGVRADLHAAEAELVAILLMAGVAISVMSGNAGPAWVGFGTAVVIIGVYEWALTQ